MGRGRRLLGQLVLVLAVTAGAFVGAKLGMLATRDAGASHNFSDVPDSAFYHDFVAFLVDNGITAGCGPGLFCGEQAVTRGQTAVFLKKLFDTFEIVRATGTLSASTFAFVIVTCPAGKRPLLGQPGARDDGQCRLKQGSIPYCGCPAAARFFRQT